MRRGRKKKALRNMYAAHGVGVVGANVVEYWYETPVVIRVEVAEHNIRDTGKINVEHLDISQYGIRMPPSVK